MWGQLGTDKVLVHLGDGRDTMCEPHLAISRGSDARQVLGGGKALKVGALQHSNFLGSCRSIHRPLHLDSIRHNQVKN